MNTADTTLTISRENICPAPYRTNDDFHKLTGVKFPELEIVDSLYYDDMCLNPNTYHEYKFVVKAYTVYDGNVYWSNKLATINERTLPAKTSKISIAKRYSKSVKLSWKPVTGATGYRVYLYKNGKYEVVAKAHKGTSFTKSALKSKTKYKFAVKAYTIYKGQVLWSDVFTTVNVTTK
jgi:hypothetical protein